MHIDAKSTLVKQSQQHDNLGPITKFQIDSGHHELSQKYGMNVLATLSENTARDSSLHGNELGTTSETCSNCDSAAATYFFFTSDDKLANAPNLKKRSCLRISMISSKNFKPYIGFVNV